MKIKGNGKDLIEINLRVNKRPYRVEIEPNILLVEFLREYLDITSPKLGCETSNCGACTVLVRFSWQKEFVAVKSCTLLAVQCNNAEIITVEGLSKEGKLNVVQQAFLEERGLQCGYCTPGFIMASIGLLLKNSSPTDEFIKRALNGNLCRCGAYLGIIKAIKKSFKNLDLTEILSS